MSTSSFGFSDTVGLLRWKINGKFCLIKGLCQS